MFRFGKTSHVTLHLTTSLMCYQAICTLSTGPHPLHSYCQSSILALIWSLPSHNQWDSHSPTLSGLMSSHFAQTFPQSVGFPLSHLVRPHVFPSNPNIFSHLQLFVLQNHRRNATERTRRHMMNPKINLQATNLKYEKFP